jgi:hypothetical protein
MKSKCQIKSKRAHLNERGAQARVLINGSMLWMVVDGLGMSQEAREGALVQREGPTF